MRIFLLTCIFVTNILFIQEVIAEDGSKIHITPLSYNGNSVRAWVVSNAFKTSALHKKIHTSQNTTYCEYHRKVDLKYNYPWLYEFSCAPEGLPRYGVINKWTKPVRISFGWPNDLKPFRPPFWSYWIKQKPQYSNLHTDDENLEQIAIEEINLNKGKLEKATNLDINLHREQDAFWPDIDDIGNVRIIFLKRSDFLFSYSPGAFFKFRSGILTSGSGSTNFEANNIRRIPGNVPFTDDSEKHLQGFYFPNVRNEIQMAACLIWEGHAEDVFRTMIRECLIRSLGLADFAHAMGGEEALLSPWNEPIPKTEFRHCVYRPQITDFDLKMLEILYHPAIKPGDDPRELNQKISHSKEYTKYTKPYPNCNSSNTP